ncbi:hypothetical protein JZ751_026373 [Albula glossodonta]|uniref:Uncharacterized protein n=1 Tax=Albula glossodonta TaxID=121402 RepID=A0A8T2PDA1_9TELE|nr:hypothetical protein JZ751_026373 [Albula glossodonta]
MSKKQGVRQGKREYHESTPSAGIHDHGDKLWIDGAEVTVPGHLGDPDVIVTLICLHSLTKNMTELTSPDHLPGHCDLQRKEKTIAIPP